MSSDVREAAGRPGASGSTRRTALVVDDAPEVRDLLRDALEDEGFAVVTSPEPPEPEEVAQSAPDVIVLDVLFGREESGIEFLRRLRAAKATADLPVVLCSGATEPIRRIEAPLLSGATGLVLKRFDVDALLEEVASVLNVASPAG